MLRRLLSLLITLGTISGGDGALSAEPLADDKAKHPVAQVLTLEPASVPSSVGRDSPIAETKLVSADLHAGETAWVGTIDKELAAATLVFPLADHVAGVAIHRNGFAPEITAISARLFGIALDHCREEGQLKVVVGGTLEPETVRSIAQEHGFLFNRQRATADGPQLEFYTNLYFRPLSSQKKHAV